MEIIIGIVAAIFAIIASFFAGIVHGAGKKPKVVVTEEMEEHVELPNPVEDLEDEPEPFPDLSGIQNLKTLDFTDSTWKYMHIRSYFLGGNTYKLDNVNLTIDRAEGEHWHGVNQCLFYMSDEVIPNKPELYEIRTSCNSNKEPWPVVKELEKKKTGRYFIIAFTNNHDFKADGEITVV